MTSGSSVAATTVLATLATFAFILYWTRDLRETVLFGAAVSIGSGIGLVQRAVCDTSIRPYTLPLDVGWSMIIGSLVVLAVWWLVPWSR
jgi:hypothetical protein